MNCKQLKNSILQWAIQGKLVPQNPKDEPASKLLERIAATRNGDGAAPACHPERSAKGTKSKDLAKKKKSKTETSRIYREGSSWFEQVGSAEPKDITEEIPFDIPESWGWARWGELADSIQYGFNAPALQSGRIRMVRISDIQNNQIIWEKVPFCDIKENEIEGYILRENDILFARTGGTVGKSFLVKSVEYEAVYAGYLIRTRYNCDLLVPQYLKFFMESSLYWDQLHEGTIATAQPNCNGKTLGKMILPIPPLAEQKRIVKKLEQILPLVDEYDQAQTQLDKLNKELPEALKKSILQQAIQGKLVPQNPKDEPADKLLERITISRHSEHSEESSKKSRKSSSKNPVSRIYRDTDGLWYEQTGSSEPVNISEEIPFEIPETWTWCRLENLGTFVRGSGIKRDETVLEGRPCVRYGEMYTTYKVKFSVVKSFTRDDIFEKCQKIVQNDILMALTGENKWDIALAAVYQGIEELALGGDLCKFTPIECNPLYLVYLINSPYGIEYKRNTSTGDIIVHISVGKLGNFLVPLPPLTEQKRIVAKLEQMFKIV